MENKANAAAAAPDWNVAPSAVFQVKKTKQSGTFDDEPAASMKFTKIIVNAELLELLSLAQLTNSGLDDYLANVTTDSRLTLSLRSENEQARNQILVLAAQRHKLLYSYCNIFYVANPYINLVPNVEYEQFVEAAKTNWKVHVEMASMPDTSKTQAAKKTSKQSKDKVGDNKNKTQVTQQNQDATKSRKETSRENLSTCRDANQGSSVDTLAQEESNKPDRIGADNSQHLKLTDSETEKNAEEAKPIVDDFTANIIAELKEALSEVTTSSESNNDSITQPETDCKIRNAAALPPTQDEIVNLVGTKTKKKEATETKETPKTIKQVLRKISELTINPLPKTASFNRLNAEKLMVLDLLSLDASERDAYIVQSAVHLQLLVSDKNKNLLMLNPEVNLSPFNRINPSLVVENANAPRITKAKIEPPITNTNSSMDSSEDLVVESVELLPPMRNKNKNSNSTGNSNRDSHVEQIGSRVVDFKDGSVVMPLQAMSKKAAKLNAKLEKKAHKAIETAKKTAANELPNKTVNKAIQDKMTVGTSLNEEKGPRKRGSRSKTVSLCSDVSDDVGSSTFRKSILKSLLDIQDTIDFQGTTGLGQSTQPKLYARFLARFDDVVERIRQKLRATPIAVPSPTTKLVKPTKNVQKSAQITCSFSGAVNDLIKLHSPETKIRMDLIVSETNSWKIDPKNQEKLDSTVKALLDQNMGKLIKGEIRINAFNVTQGYVTTARTTSAHSDESTAEEDVAKDTLIESVILRQYAMHGDSVQVFVFNSSIEVRNPLGFVTKILEERNDRTVIGHLSLNKNKNYAIFKPITKRIGDLRIMTNDDTSTSSNIELNDQMLYMAKVIRWTNEIPIGEITELIGEKNTLETSNKAILLENKLEVPSFSQSIIDALPNDDFEIPAEEYSGRENLTAKYVFTIDPATARDLDDALSVEQLDNGNYEVGVHISDVTYFLPEVSELDELVRKQATSIYLVDTVYHMLPRSLCMTCSLLPGQDKLSFSVFWEMNEAGEILSTRFARTIINSCVQLAYSHAQRMIVEPDHVYEKDELPGIRTGFESSIIADKVRLLHRLAKPLRQKRFDNFCLSINQPKISFKLDPDSGEPVSFERYTQLDSNWLIEEFMLLANQSVATRIHQHYPDEAILRNHVPPKWSNMEFLVRKLEQYGFKIALKTPEDFSKELNTLLGDPNHSDVVHAVLSDMVMKQITRAQYFCSGEGKPLAHFALSIPIYTHFTSPIRRYPDIMVHRLLAASLKLTEKPCRNPEELQMIADRCNVQKYNAKLAGDLSTQLYFKHFIQARGKHQMAAVIVDMVNTEMFEVMLLETGMKFTIKLMKQKPALKLVVRQTTPLCGEITFGAPVKHTIRCEVFAEIRVELHINADNHIVASIVAPDIVD